MQDDLRAELIKQFPSEVIETKDMTGKEYYACPTCKRAVATGTEKMSGMRTEIKLGQYQA